MDSRFRRLKKFSAFFYVIKDKDWEADKHAAVCSGFRGSRLLRTFPAGQEMYNGQFKLERYL
jgi:hypothetical protein